MTEEWSAQAQGSPASGSGVSVQRPMADEQRRHHDLTRVCCHGFQSTFVDLMAERGIDATVIRLPTCHACVCLLGHCLPCPCEVVCPGSLVFLSPSRSL